MTRALLLPLFLLALPACTGVFLQPDRRVYSDPRALGMDVEERVFPSADGTKLHGWLFPAKGTLRGLVVQLHGNAENVSSHAHSLAWLAAEGYALFAFDYRGYGKSEGESEMRGAVEDSEAGIREGWEIARKIRAPRFAVVGQSLGGALAMRALANDEIWKSRVDLLVLDSTFGSFQRMASAKLASFWLTWPFSWLGYVLVSDRASAEGEFGKLPTPILVLHDRNDPVVPYRQGERLFSELPGPKDLWTTEDGFHVGSFRRDRPANRAEFVKKLSGP